MIVLEYAILNSFGVGWFTHVNTVHVPCWVKTTKGYQEVPEEQKWRVALVKDMLECRWNTLEIDFINDEVEDMDASIETLYDVISPFLSSSRFWGP